MRKEIQISDELAAEAMQIGKIENRTLEKQIEHWVKIGKVIEENPDCVLQVNQGNPIWVN